MANSTDYSFVPLLGEFITCTDPDDGVVKPAIIDDSNAFIPVNSVGNGNTPSAVVSSPQGRPGSLKNAIQLISMQSQAFTNYNVTMFFNVPAGARGLPSSRFSAAQILDSANYPLYDASQFMPLFSVLPSFSQFSAEAVGPLDTPFTSPNYLTAPGLSTIQWAYGATIYVPPQLYSTYFTLLNVVPSSLGQYGVIGARFHLSSGEGVEVAVQPNQVFQLVADFSWSAGN
jgi:hypothetical protein